jgi:hypothetical protein
MPTILTGRAISLILKAVRLFRRIRELPVSIRPRLFIQMYFSGVSSLRYSLKYRSGQ